MTDTPANLPPSSNSSTPVSPGPTPPRKKASLGKKLFRLFAVLFLLFIAVLLILFLNINTLVKMGVVRGGKYATEQETVLQAANLSLAGGALQLNSLDISNPPNSGYTTPKFLSMKDFQITLQSSSVFTHTVIIDSIAIQGLDLTLEQTGGKNNLSEIMAIVQKNTASTGDASKSSPGKELKIGKLSLVGTKVHVRSGAPLNISLDLDLPPLTIEDPTNPDGRPMKIADLLGTILLQLSKEIVDNPAIPGGIKDSMKNVTALVGNLRGQLDKNAKVLGKDFQGAAKNMDAQGVKDAEKNAAKDVTDAEKNFGGLFNQKNNSSK